MEKENYYVSYDPFARIYNKHWGNGFTLRIQPILERLVLSSLPIPGPILDLCCGTGQLSQMLSQKGYDVTGVDSSAEILRYARINAPDAQFIHADVRNLSLPASYPCIFSLYDSLNHIMLADELMVVFQNIYRTLEMGGYFLFDLNLERGYLDRWKGSFNIVEEHDICIVKSSYDANQKIACMDITLLQEQEQKNWQRTDFTLYQRAYDQNDVLHMLKNIGFQHVALFDAGEELGLRGNNGRGFFIARKV